MEKSWTSRWLGQWLLAPKVGSGQWPVGAPRATPGLLESHAKVALSKTKNISNNIEANTRRILGFGSRIRKGSRTQSLYSPTTRTQKQSTQTTGRSSRSLRQTHLALPVASCSRHVPAPGSRHVGEACGSFTAAWSSEQERQRPHPTDAPSPTRPVSFLLCMAASTSFPPAALPRGCSLPCEIRRVLGEHLRPPRGEGVYPDPVGQPRLAAPNVPPRRALLAAQATPPRCSSYGPTTMAPWILCHGERRRKYASWFASYPKCMLHLCRPLERCFFYCACPILCLTLAFA